MADEAVEGRPRDADNDTDIRNRLLDADNDTDIRNRRLDADNDTDIRNRLHDAGCDTDVRAGPDESAIEVSCLAEVVAAGLLDDLERYTRTLDGSGAGRR